jgi:hypothetical protein
MSLDRRQETSHRRRRGWNCYRWIISVAIASQIVQLAGSFSPPASVSFSLQRRRLPGVKRISRPHRRSRSNCKFASEESHGGENSTSNAEQQVSWNLVLVPPPQIEETPAHEHMTRKDQVALALASVGVILAFTGLIKISGAGGWRYYLAGGICAAASHGIPVPIDVVKTRIQLDPKLADLHFLEATRSIIEEEGLRALWTGLGPTVWGCKSLELKVTMNSLCVCRTTT